ncbi:hypothetical protein ACIBG4_40915 [Nonomuraea sp. NPDC050383]|uniref:hypothetical protein n=1 Tax=Nonomuraea sp. NPDC050383 TaxID=3364362 RepID=UPI003791CE26
MSQNTATKSPTPTTTSSTPTRRLLVVLTMQNGSGDVKSSSHEMTVPAGTRHLDFLAYMLQAVIPEDMRDGVVLHYSVHPAVIA